MSLKIKPLSEWLTSDPLIISGPCGAETEEQVLSTARAISKDKRVKVFRAGIWKPRTRPNAFEGVGVVGLRWLKRLKEETGLLTTVEVANARHTEEALSHGVDILWIGARTTVNPFSVQEIADVLKGVKIPVMVKNPVHPDINLWIGAIERINQAGIDRIIAIHRGFHGYEKSKYRNQPLWEIPIELKRMFPGLPVICDPSHICGRRDLLQSVSQKALDLDMAGLMIESHINPDSALSDSAQQLTPSALKAMLDSLIFRKSNASNEEFQHSLESLRSLIDEIDDEVVRAFSRRMKLAEKIGEFKKLNDVTILQVKRWEEIISRNLLTGRQLDLSETFIKDLFVAVHKESIRRQTLVMNKRE